jgi:hypothetical protein
MNWVLHAPGQSTSLIDKPLMRIGSDPSSDIYLPHPGLAAVHAILHSGNQLLWLEPVSQPVHINGRRVHSASIIRPGDDLQLGNLPVKVQTSTAPLMEVLPAAKALNFSGRVVLRVLTGRDVGRAFPLMNSLCIGRSVLSEIRIDDLALAERQVLVQRHGNSILVKNLSPVLEMRVNGWSCTEAVLAPGSQLSIDQHRFVLEAPCPDLGVVDEPLSEPMDEVPNEAEQETTKPSLLSKSQWLLLASAIGVSVAIILLLTLSS